MPDEIPANINGDAKLKSLDAEEREALRVQGLAVIRADPVVGGACTAMIVAGQLFNVANAALQQRVNTDGKGKISPELYAVLRASAQSAAKAPFTREEMLKQLCSKCVPWLVDDLMYTVAGAEEMPDTPPASPLLDAEGLPIDRTEAQEENDDGT